MQHSGASRLIPGRLDPAAGGSVRVSRQTVASSGGTMLGEDEFRLPKGVMYAAVAWGATVGLLVVMWRTNDLRWGAVAIVAGQVAALLAVRQLSRCAVRTIRNGLVLHRESVTPLSRV